MKDFATRKQWFDDDAPKAQKKWLRWWLLALVIVVVLIVASSLYQRVTRPAPVVLPPVAAPVVKAPPKQAVQFDFYHVLAQDGGSTSAPHGTVKKDNADIPAIPTSYVVALTTYPSRAVAEQHKAQLILSGAPADALIVHQLRENAYQLQAGPFTTRADALTAQKSLAAASVKGDVQVIN